jgi:hypothetical protein
MNWMMRMKSLKMKKMMNCMRNWMRMKKKNLMKMMN